MIKMPWMFLVVVAIATTGFSSLASAGTISPTVAPVASGPGLGLVSIGAIVTPNPRNDNQTGGGAADNNVVIPLKRFDFNNYIDIVFTVNSDDGTTEYKFTEFVDNNTGINWSSYTMQLGSGTGTAFVPATTGALDFDAPGFDGPPTSAPLSTVATSPYQLTFSGGIQGTGAVPYTFRLDVPDGLNSFTLRQTPIAVPEPASLALLGLALIGAVACRRER
jgi:hypothetical protein